MDRTLLGRRQVLLLGCAAATLLGGAGCFEEVPDPTQGFVVVETGGVNGAEVFVDGASAGVVATVGPLDAGEHVLRVHRAGYLAEPAERTVRVEGGRTARAAFALTLAFTGSVRVSASDEIRGTEVTGAEILADTGGGFVATGVTTPGTVAGLPPGTARMRVRAAGFADSDPADVEVVVAETAELGVELGPPRAALAEMFTYTLCPNCPYAAHALDSLHVAHPDRFFVVEWHIWPPPPALPFYDARWEPREDYYRGGAPGWPATVFQGGAGFTPAVVEGALPSELAEFNVRADAVLGACGNDCPVALVVDGTIGATAADATVRIKWRGGSLPGNLRLRAVLTESDAVGVPGNQPNFDFVARDLFEQPVALTVPGDVLPVPLSLPVSGSWAHDNLALVVFVQSDATREVLAVGGLP